MMFEGQMKCTDSTFPSLKLSPKRHSTQLVTVTIPHSLHVYSLYLFHIPIPDIPADRSLADHPLYTNH